MSDPIAVLIAVALLLVLLLLRVPIAFALAGAGVLGITLVGGWASAFASLGGTPFTATASYSLVVIPMFILLGSLATQARIAEQVFAVAQRHLGRIPGGLGVATVAACAGFAAISGSSVATAATFGKLSIGEMRKHGYPGAFAAGVVATAGTLGAMIPPSILLVMYAILTGESVAVMLAAGIIPGIVQALAIIAYVMWRGRSIKPPTRADGAADTTSGQRPPYRGLLRLGLIFVIVVSGVYTGIFTVSESAAIAAIFAGLMLLVERRDEGIKGALKRMYDGLRDTASTSSMILLILVGSGLFSYFLVLAGVPTAFADWAAELPVPPVMVVVALLLTLIPLGMFLDSFSILAITVPLIYPVVTDLGFDGVWLGVLIVILCEIGLITPPVGVNAYVVAGASHGISVEQVFKGIVPFVVLMIGYATIIFLVPSLSTWLPTFVVQ
jgi:C4-dicarboxylate transporter DctM subunit